MCLRTDELGKANKTFKQLLVLKELKNAILSFKKMRISITNPNKLFFTHLLEKLLSIFREPHEI
jgi:hypothetical protein